MLTRPGFSTISDGTIAAAKVPGNIHGVKRLFTGVTKTNIRKELLDVVFYHLQPQWMELPPAEYGSKQVRAERAAALALTARFCASEGLAKILLESPAALHGRLVQIIRSHLDNFFAWLTVLSPDRLSQMPTHLTHCHLDPSKQCAVILYLMDIGFAGGVLAPTIRASTEVVEYSIAAWTAKDQVCGTVYCAIEKNARCAITTLFRNLLVHDETRDMIFYTVYSTGGKPKHLRTAIIDAIVARCTVLGAFSREKLESIVERTASGPKLVFMYLNHNIAIVQRLCSHPDMRAALLKSTVFEEIVRILRLWILDRSDREKDRQDRYQGFALLPTLLVLVSPLDQAAGRKRICDGYTKDFASSVRRMLEAGLVPILFEGMHSISAEDKENADACCSSLRWLNNVCNHCPSLLETLKSDITMLQGKAFWSGETLSRNGWGATFESMAFNIAAGLGCLGGKDIFLCDNLSCRNDLSGLRPRSCSGCEAMVYCSQICQEKDWDALHRDECSIARDVFHRDINPDIPYYRPLTRYHHAQLAAQRAVLELEEDSLRFELDRMPSVYVVRVDQPSILHHVPGYMFWRIMAPAQREGVAVSRTRDKSGCNPPAWDHYLDKRVRSLFHAYETEGWKKGQQLVEATYHLGRQEYVVLVLVEDMTEGRRKTRLEGKRVPNGEERRESESNGTFAIICCVTELFE